MRNSESRGIVRSVARALAMALMAGMVGGCARAPSASSVGEIDGCVVEGDGWSATQRTAALALRDRVAASPLFAAAIQPSGLLSCRIAREEGLMSVRMRARDGAAFAVDRDDAIESSDEEARLVAPLREEPIALLERAERAAFGAGGCAIDWQSPETLADAAPGKGEMRLYRGDRCSCAARVHRTVDGTIDRLGLRSAC